MARPVWCGGWLRGTVRRMAGTDALALGRYGEELAAQHLVSLGMVVLHRNWRCRQGELDLVARDVDGTVVFAEVKTRSRSDFGEPSEAVSRRKAAKVRQVACLWLAECRPAGSPEIRFDVIGIVRERGSVAVLTHLQAAF